MQLQVWGRAAGGGQEDLGDEVRPVATEVRAARSRRPARDGKVRSSGGGRGSRRHERRPADALGGFEHHLYSFSEEIEFVGQK